MALVVANSVGTDIQIYFDKIYLHTTYQIKQYVIFLRYLTWTYIVLNNTVLLRIFNEFK